MKKELRNKKKKGFTLIELIVVIVILGVLALIVVPKIGGFTSDAALSSHNANVRTLQSAAMMYMAEEGVPDTDMNADTTKEKIEKYVQEWPKIPKGRTDEGTEYTVEIDDEGVVTVDPGLASE